MEFLRLLEGIRSPFLNGFFQFFTYFGQELLIIGVVCVLYWCLNKKLACQIGLTFFVSGLFLQCLKITFRIPRPWILDSGFHAVASAIPAATGYSFPSGHTMGATALFFTLALAARKKWMKSICCALFVLVGFSRMYLGVHTPKDVLTAMVLSIAVSLLIQRMIHRIPDSIPANGAVGLFLGFFSIIAMVYSLVLLQNQTITIEYATDCCKAAGAGLGFALGWFLERSYVRFQTKASVPRQIVKLVSGLLIALLLKGLMRALLGDSIPSEIFQYFILVLWVIAGWPFFMVKIKLTEGIVEK